MASSAQTTADLRSEFAAFERAFYADRPTPAIDYDRWDRQDTLDPFEAEYGEAVMFRAAPMHGWPL